MLDGIEWQGQKLAFEAVRWLAWDSLASSNSEGKPVKTDYIIRIGGAKRPMVIEKLGVEQSEAFIGTLQKLVGKRLAGEILVGLKEGKSAIIGEVIFDDHGITLTKRDKFARDPVYCRWEDISLSRDGGDMVISSKKMKDTYVQLSYLDVDNAQVLDLILYNSFSNWKGSLSKSLLVE